MTVALRPAGGGPGGPAQAGTLSEYGFTDLYLTTGTTDVEPVVKGLKARDVVQGDGIGGVRPVPDFLKADVMRLGEDIRDMWIKTGGQREFVTVREGVSYRCALIDAPESTIKRPTEDVDIQNWCVRHITTNLPRLESLGMPRDMQTVLTDLRNDRGLLLVSGSFGSGKSTTASVILDHWVRMTRDVAISLEDPPEYPLGRVTTDEGAIYQIDLTERPIEEAIKYARRWGPRFFFLGEVRTPQAAAEMLHMSISGPMVVCTIHAADPVQAIISLVRFAAREMSESTAREMVAASLKSVIWQEIVGGRLSATLGVIGGAENFVVRKKIELGQYQQIYEDLERQRVNRTRPGGAVGIGRR